MEEVKEVKDVKEVKEVEEMEEAKEEEEVREVVRVPDKVFINVGGTSLLYRVSPGMVFKVPDHHGSDLDERTVCHFETEKKILAYLGDHPRIVKYHGLKDDGILFEEAIPGSLDTYLSKTPDAPEASRVKWCRQMIEAIVFIHSRGVIHCDLRPTQLLLHTNADGTSMDIWLCDFGGAQCKRLGVGSGQQANPGYFDPNSWIYVPGVECDYEPTEAVDIFGMGSTLYHIITGHRPHRGADEVFETDEQLLEYMDRVDELFTDHIFPETKGLVGGAVMLGCWTYKYTNAEEVLQAWKLETSEANECIL